MPVVEFPLTFSAPVAQVGSRGACVGLGQATPVLYAPFLLATGRPAIAAMLQGCTVLHTAESPYNQTPYGNMYTQISDLAAGQAAGGVAKQISMLASSGQADGIDLHVGFLASTGQVTQWTRGPFLGLGIGLRVGGLPIQSRGDATVTAVGATGAVIAILWSGVYNGITALIGLTAVVPKPPDPFGLGRVSAPVVLKTGVETLGTAKLLKALPIGTDLFNTWVTYVHESKLRSFVWHTQNNTVTATWIDTIFPTGWYIHTTAMLVDPLVVNAGWVAISARNEITGQGVLRVARLTNLDSATPTVDFFRGPGFPMNTIAQHIGLMLGIAPPAPPSRLVLLWSQGLFPGAPATMPIYRSVFSADLRTAYLQNELVPLTGGGLAKISQLACPSNGTGDVQYSGVPYAGLAGFRSTQNIGYMVRTSA